MNGTRLLVGPFNRVEGDLEIRLDVEDGQVSAAYVNSPLYRGFERMLLDKDPRDALTLTPRICGICSISQSVAAAAALGDAAGLPAAPQGALVTQLLHAVENVSDHITHFNLFFMPDFTRPVYAPHAWRDEAVERFAALKGSAQHAAIDARAKLMHITGLLAGKWPHTLAIQPGGATKAPTQRDRTRILLSLRAFRKYLETHLFGAPVESVADLGNADALMAWERGDLGFFLRIATDLGLDGLGRGCGRYLSFGAYPGADGPLFARGVWVDGAAEPLDTSAIAEDLSHAWMLGPTAHPTAGETLPDEEMRESAYSWCKAPRLGGEIAETGALARQVVDGHPLALELAQSGGVLARVAGRLLEVARTQIAMERWASALRPEEPFMHHVDLPKSASGAGLVEAARGALGHWLRIEDGRIGAYQIIAPTTWNFSPRDASDQAGPVEQALVGAEVRPGEDSPVAVQHIVRSFDPCMVCTVH
ncbi:nickel-dependent hydrogenase large subunit [Tropicimonas marinistellae]|uniref:nickel-dependent hydrogenase large subunit n=1 Tax=Tropicimonas marinistellae TaxID=1739787 RepID=UPI000836671E|nr:nickel-dependent hydrogenase large subunit [Tropicimonas marinistellae]